MARLTLSQLANDNADLKVKLAEITKDYNNLIEEFQSLCDEFGCQKRLFLKQSDTNVR